MFMGPGKSDVLYNLPEEGTEECPVSFITPESQALVEQFSSSRMIHKQHGLGSLGDPSDWPGWMLDAATVLADCEQKQQEALQDELDRHR